ncbi:putative ankyrin repeat-containing domain, PGG domain-containing protein [Rosa chinensis]|uniref:Putative ankyrin repeat-containing domain, PGG domain-containing protein n=1 Tax=Rosa chinensis TaxID=74649 RepID=A0A2P6RG19_ROSCH|nr:putative ankyrin repeat-containing domain, PGG domain-containing protein [Rosa chinensis]
MEITEDHHEDDTTRSLYEAAVAGSVSSLIRLIQKDPLILNKVSLTHFSETPLHISALLGHLDFTKALLIHNSRLARVRDSLRRPPLLLASAEGHKETVEALLKAYPDACLFRDQDGRVPLHYAAMRGHAEVLAQLICAKPESVTLRVLDRGDTVFHLCVTYNQLECLKLLVEEVGDNNRDVLSARAGCDGGITILELAVMLRQIETLRYLLSLPVVWSEANVVHGKVLNIVENMPKDFVSLEIQRVLMDSGIIRNGRNENEQQPLVPNNKSKKEGKKGRKSTKNVNEKRSSKSGNWVEEKRGMLMVVATMISTMTFQAAINPPGGFWQEINTNTAFGGVSYCNDTNPCFVGTAVSSYIHPDLYINFQTADTICFLFSLSITLLLIRGFPLHKRVLVWLLSVVMCLTLTFLTLTFNAGIKMVIPKRVDNEDLRSPVVIGSATLFWGPMLGLVVLYQTIRLLVWLVKKLWRLVYPKNKMTSNSNANLLQTPINSHEISSYV